MLTRQKSHPSHKAMNDTILRLFLTDCVGLPSVASVLRWFTLKARLRPADSVAAAFVRLRRSEGWWRRGESNPRPMSLGKAFMEKVKILSKKVIDGAVQTTPYKKV